MDITDFFENPSPWGIGLAIIFGAIWLAALRPLKLSTSIPWILLLIGAVLFAPSIAWIQAPLQTLVGNRIIGSMGIVAYQSNLLWAGIPVVLFSGLIQEGAKLLPVAGYWLYKRRKMNSIFGLSLGAVVGAGYGIFEAQWLLNSVFASGWSFSTIQLYGFLGIAAFVERFFTISFHTASAALACWGLARGRGWQFYLLASFLHFLVNYGVLLSAKGIFGTIQIEIWVYVISAVVFGVVMWLRHSSKLNSLSWGNS
jgi:hypothetical protein